MEELHFALPTLATTAMSRADQSDLLLNQATAIIVSAWLDHANAVLAHHVAANLPTGGTHIRGEWLLTRAELPPLIDSVQAALRTI
jgi:hypothetical protein